MVDFDIFADYIVVVDWFVFLLDFVVKSALDGDFDFDKVFIMLGDFYIFIVGYFP